MLNPRCSYNSHSRSDMLEFTILQGFDSQHDTVTITLADVLRVLTLSESHSPDRALDELLSLTKSEGADLYAVAKRWKHTVEFRPQYPDFDPDWPVKDTAHSAP